MTPGNATNKGEGLTTPFILTVAALVGVIVAILATIVPRTMREAALDAERRNAIESAEQFRLTHERYVQATRQPGPRSRIASGASQSPGEFLRNLSNDTSGRETRFIVSSPYPYRPRLEPWSEFQKQAWEVFQKNPDVVFAENETIDGKRYLHLAMPQVMTSMACIECHNTDPMSPRRDWSVGDLAGLIEVYKLIEPNMKAADHYASTIVSFVVAAGVFAGLLVILLNISSVRRARERSEARKRIEYLAYYDTLTGALNRGHFLGLLAEWLKSPEARARGVAIHFVDLDKFKEVNDTLGHDVGDDLVREATARLIALAGKSDLVGRVGGDEFVMAQWKVASRTHVEERAQAIVQAIAQPFNLRGNRISISASVGVVDRFVTSSATELLKCADLALYRAKAMGRNRYVIFNRQIEEERAARLELEQRVRDALDASAFRLFFQPICDAATGLILGFETLIRLFDENGKLVPTQEFVSCAESMGLITHIDEWVLRNACAAAAQWPDNTTVAVNLSPANFGRAAITGRQLRRVVADVLEETGLPPERLELEITEGILLENTEDVLGELRGLKELGVAISLDDFGAGYSSMNYLWKFPFDKLKIDGSFIRASSDAGSVIPSILRAIVSLGRDLHLKVCAEGVEHETQRDLLVTLGADQIQGYLYGRPTDRDEVAALILKNFAEHSVRAPARRADAARRRAAAAASYARRFAPPPVSDADAQTRAPMLEAPQDADTSQPTPPGAGPAQGDGAGQAVPAFATHVAEQVSELRAALEVARSAGLARPEEDKSEQGEDAEPSPRPRGRAALEDIRASLRRVAVR